MQDKINIIIISTFEDSKIKTIFIFTVKKIIENIDFNFNFNKSHLPFF
jgi:hypothetical protein